MGSRRARRAVPKPFSPLGFGQIMNQGSRIYQRSFRHLIVISLITFAPIALIALMVVSESMPLGVVIDSDGNLRASTQASQDRLDLVLGLSYLATFVGGIISMASLHHAVANAYVRREPRWEESIRASIRRLPAIIALTVAGIVVAVAPLLPVGVIIGRIDSEAVAIGGMLVVIAWVTGVLAWVPISLAAMMREQIGPVAALRRGWALLRTRWVPTVALVLVSSWIVGVFFGIVGAVTAGGLVASADTVTGFVAALSFAQAVGAIFAVPLFVTIVTVAYFDLRVRAEGYDENAHHDETRASGGINTRPVPIDPSTIHLPMAVPPTNAHRTSVPNASPPPLPTDPPVRGPRWSEPLGE